MGKQAKQIDPLLFLKIIIPFALPLAGFLLPSVFHGSNLPSEPDSCSNSFQEEDEEQNAEDENEEKEEKIEYYEEQKVEKEEEEEEEEEEEHLQTDSIVLASQTGFLTRNVVLREQVEEEPNLLGEIDGLNNRVSDIEERERQMQLEFSEYCDMKNYESLVLKLQIMCLGLKTEYLEKQNQRLEETIVKLVDEKEEFFKATMGEIKRLNKIFEKILKRNKHNLLAVHQRMQDYEAREAEMLKRNQDLEIVVRDAKEMILKNCTSKGKKVKELTIEQGHETILTKNKKMLNQINKIRAEWEADMEEMIYLGWINTCLRHEISVANKMEKRKHAQKLNQNILSITFDSTSPVPMSTETKREEITEVPVRSDEALQECDEEIQSEQSIDCTNSIIDPGEICMDVMVRKSGINLGKQKLIRKLKGWAKGKGKCKLS